MQNGGIQIPRSELAKLRGKLRKGDQKAIASQMGLSDSAVYAALNGRSTNNKVVDAALAIVKARQQEEEAYTTLINEL